MPGSTEEVQATLRIERFHEVARIITGNSDATAIQGALWIDSLVKDLEIPRLQRLLSEADSEIILSEAQIREIVSGTVVASSTKGNPVAVSEKDIEDILRNVL